MLKQLSLHLVVVVELRSNKMFESLQYACDCEHKSAKKSYQQHHTQTLTCAGKIARQKENYLKYQGFPHWFFLALRERSGCKDIWKAFIK